MTMGEDMHSMQLTLHRRQVLVAAASDDPQAAELMNALRATGLDVVVAETLELATRADEFGACIVLLRPGQWRSTPVIAAAIRSNPRSLIPVLIEPMPLPPGSWTTEPLSLKKPVSETVRELAPRIASALQSRVAETASTARSTAQVADPYFPSSARRPLKRRVRLHFSIPLNTVLIAGVLLLGLGLLLYTSPHNRALLLPPSSTLIVPTSTPIQNRAYTANIPGPGCDASGADWEVGSYFKAPVTPTPQSRTTATVKATPTFQVVNDPYTATACRPDGLLVIHKAHFDTYATIIFMSQGGSLARHFKTQITATVVSASSSADVDLGVRNQSGAPDSREYDNGYGDDTLDVGVGGLWATQRINNVNDTIDATFTQGAVQPAKTFTLGAEVDGARIIYTINGRIVTTIVDPTYPAGYGITFGLADTGTHTPPSALFSHFVYTPLPNTHLTPANAVATATAQAIKNLHTSYTAAVPGFGCDKGAGQWEPVTEANDNVTARCLANGLLISQGASAKYLGQIAFYGLDGNFPANYAVKTQINVSDLNGGCAGVSTRTDTQAAGYAFLVCSDGSWQILRYDSNGGQGHTLAQGQVAQQSSYMLEATSNGITQSLTLNGIQVAAVKDATLKTTDHIELVISLPAGTAGSAIFSQFAFTPLS